MRLVRRLLVCERVRAQVSLQLDGELSELERRMMESHLARCPECGSFARDAASLTRLLREAPLERPPYPVVVRRPRRVSVVRLQVGFAAAVAIAMLGVAVQIAGLERQGSSSQLSLQTPVRYDTDSELALEVRLILDNGRWSGQRGDHQGSGAIPI